MNVQNSNSARLLQILWIAFLPTPVILGVLAWVAARLAVPADREGVSVSLSDPLVLVFALAAVVIFIVATQLSRFLEPRSDGLNEQQNLQQFALVMLLLRCALFESIAIIGFLLALLRGASAATVPFMLLALVGLILSRPSSGWTKQTG